MLILYPSVYYYVMWIHEKETHDTWRVQETQMIKTWNILFYHWEYSWLKIFYVDTSFFVFLYVPSIPHY